MDEKMWRRFRFHSGNRKSKIENLKSVRLLTLCVTLVLCGAVAHAQQKKKIPRLGYVSGSGDANSPGSKAFRQGLRDLGYIEGENIRFEYRSAEGRLDRLPGLVAELVQLKVDVLVV